MRLLQTIENLRLAEVSLGRTDTCKVTGPWTNLCITLATNEVMEFQDTHPPAGAAFYRVEQQ